MPPTSARTRPEPPPARVFVPYGKRPPRGVLWVSNEAMLYHARPARQVRMFGYAVMPAEPARMDEFRELIRNYVMGRRTDYIGWDYYRGRRLACPYRCALDSTTCPVDILVQELNAPRPARSGL